MFELIGRGASLKSEYEGSSAAGALAEAYHPSMGRIKYDGSGASIVMDDATVAHLKIIICSKLRRHESFLMTWVRADGGEDARTSIWLHPAIPLQFGFDDAKNPQIDPARITTMMDSLNRVGELVLDEYIIPAAPIPAVTA